MINPLFIVIHDLSVSTLTWRGEDSPGVCLPHHNPPSRWIHSSCRKQIWILCIPGVNRHQQETGETTNRISFSCRTSKTFYEIFTASSRRAVAANSRASSLPLNISSFLRFRARSLYVSRGRIAAWKCQVYCTRFDCPTGSQGNG